MAFTKINAAGIGTTETVTVDGLTVINDGSFGGNLTVSGVLTYEDVTNVDSVGLITARNGIVVGSGITLSKDGDIFATGITTVSGNVKVGTGITLSPDGDGFYTGVVTATTFSGSLAASNLTGALPAISGANLTNLDASDLASGTVPTARLGSGTASSSTFLRGDSTFAAVTSTTINNNADNRLITGSDTANTLNGEANLTLGNNLQFTTTANGHSVLLKSTGAYYNKLSMDSGVTSAGAFLNVIDFSWDGDKVSDIISVSGSDTTNKDDGHLIFRTSASQGSITERLRITSGGNIGIGNRTTSPDELLHVHTASGEAKIHVEAATNARVRIRAHSGESIVQFADSGSSNPGEINYTHSSDSMSFRTNGSVRSIIDSSGNMVIGDSSADAKLHVHSANHYVLTSSGVAHRHIHCSAVNGNAGEYGGAISFGMGSTGAAAVAGVQGAADADNVGLAFITHNSGTGSADASEMMRITSAGDMVLGGTAVEAQGALTFEPDRQYGAARITFNRANSGSNGVSVVIELQNNNSQVGRIEHDNTSAGLVSSSDYRLKENDVAISDGIARVKQLRPIRFNFKNEPSKTVDGFFAHEISSAVPEAVSGEKDAVDSDGNMIIQGVCKEKLVPLLTAALQEAIAKIETLETKVAALEG